MSQTDLERLRKMNANLSDRNRALAQENARLRKAIRDLQGSRNAAPGSKDPGRGAPHFDQPPNYPA